MFWQQLNPVLSESSSAHHQLFTWEQDQKGLQA